MEVVVVGDTLVEVEVDEAPPEQATVSKAITAIPAASALTGARLPSSQVTSAGQTPDLAGGQLVPPSGVPAVDRVVPVGQKVE